MRILVIDESLGTGLAVELGKRGRTAESVAALGLTGSSDLELLLRLDQQLSDWVLVTADDRLPEDHAGALAAGNGALATIDSAGGRGSTLEVYRREVVHRWAHAMNAQRSGTVRRYGLSTKRIWRSRRVRPARAGR